MDSSIINIGRVPKYVGEFIEGNKYKKYNICSLYGSAFINLDDSNSSVPVNLERDSSGYLTGYTVNRGWDFVANSLDCSVECSKVIEDIEENYYTKEGTENYVDNEIAGVIQRMNAQDASLDSSIVAMVTEYNISLHQKNMTNGSPRYDTSIFTFTEAVNQVPNDIKRGGLKLTFNASSSSDSSLMDHVETYELNSNVWSNDASKWYRNDINFTRIFERTEVEESISPNVLNRWGEIEALTIYSFQGAQEGCVNEYMLEFTVSGNNFTLTLPDGIRWIEEPTWENGYTYQVSIINNLAVFAGWEVT